MRRIVPSEPTKRSHQAEQSEDELDLLLTKVEEKKAKKQREAEVEQPEAVDIFRGLMRQVYIPAFDSLREKYRSKGVHMDMDADELLGGGKTLKIRMVYGDLSLELDGTVMRGGVAFYIIRGVGETRGAMISGPLLRIRNLSADDFRQFIVQHLGQLIKDALRQT